MDCGSVSERLRRHKEERPPFGGLFIRTFRNLAAVSRAWWWPLANAVTQALPLLGRHAPVAVAELLAAILVHLPVASVIFTDALLLIG